MTIRSLALYAFVAAVSIASSARAQQCSCNLPPPPLNCAQTQPLTGTCDYERCGTPCVAGDQVIGSHGLCQGLEIDFECQHTCNGSQCLQCSPGFYGPSCLPCPNCNGGVCNQGITGNGVCSNCPAGRNGPFCQYSSSGTCDGHGTPNFDGSCTCNAGFIGTSCNACAAEYYNFPVCRFCDAASTCSNLGTCSSQGTCVCIPQYAGANCAACAANYYAWPACVFCDAQVTCHGHGSCDVNGVCSCEPHHTGPACNQCEPGHYGPNCLPCACQNSGVCGDGFNGNGSCLCPAGVGGAQCQYTRGGTCSGHGTPNNDGSCVCDANWQGAPNCSACTAGTGGPSCAQSTVSLAFVQGLVAGAPGSTVSLGFAVTETNGTFHADLASSFTPAGFTATISPASFEASGSGTLSFAIDATVEAGVYPITLIATGTNGTSAIGSAKVAVVQDCTPFEEQATSLQQQLSALNVSLVQCQADDQAQLALEAQLQAQLVAQEAQLASCNGQQAALQGQLAACTTSLGADEQSLALCQQQLSDVGAEAAALQSQVTTLSQQLTDAQSQLQLCTADDQTAQGQLNAFALDLLGDTVSAPELQFIRGVVAPRVAAAEAVLPPAKRGKTAQKRLDEGDAALAAGDLQTALQKYKAAWKAANDVLGV